MNFCGCGKQICKRSARCSSCAQLHIAKQERKPRKLGEVAKKYKLDNARSKLKEAERLYALVTGKQRRKHWYSQITQLTAEIVELETGGKQHARSE